MSKFNWDMKACGVILLWATMAIALPAQTFTTLHSFNGTDGSTPNGGMLQATNGNLYGTAETGGAYGMGTVFKINTNGTLTTIYSFCPGGGVCTDGEFPEAGLVQGTNGNFYGTTYDGGAPGACTSPNGCGTVFKITPSGTLTTLHSFCSQSGCPDGENPSAGLIQGANGNFYGTMAYGGTYAQGTVFKITPGGVLTTLYSFCPGGYPCTDGANPFAGLVQGTNGDFYGTTNVGGAHGYGSVFKITPSGVLTTLYSFCAQGGCTDGAQPSAGLIQATNGRFYGTTQSGGDDTNCDGGCGTIFKITPSGVLTTLYSFCPQSGCADGENPFAGLVQGTNGTFYGTTRYGGANNNNGTIFKITPSGTLATLYNFCSQTNCADGTNSQTALIQDTNGKFYGTTYLGGANNAGAIFRLSVGLGPFVAAEPTLGAVGASVKILGTSLTGSTSVTFNGTAATFTVVSASEITTTVPTGATSGTVQVVTPGGTLSSNVPFTVN
jgi:uncharacterized repeat protein (TIGR03803 family)